jgi:hypothetical protein
VRNEILWERRFYIKKDIVVMEKKIDDDDNCKYDEEAENLVMCMSDGEN